MKKLLWRPLLWALILWFYGGTAYLRWTALAWFPSQGRKDGIERYVISAETDRIIASPFIITPLLFFCSIPVACVAMPINGITNWTVDWIGYPPDHFYRPIVAISPLLLSLGIYFLILRARHEIQKRRNTLTCQSR